ncbi:MAG: RND transporter [Paracoccaceae bacterium]
MLDKIPLFTIFLVAMTLGLAPFTPEPHIWEKLKMLVDGQLVQPIDIFDLILHGAPWLLLAAKLVRVVMTGKTS